MNNKVTYFEHFVKKEALENLGQGKTPMQIITEVWGYESDASDFEEGLNLWRHLFPNISLEEP